MTHASSTERLAAVFNDWLSVAERAHAAGERVVVAGSPSVPIELVRAAGLYPVVIHGRRSRTPRADMVLERGVFEPRIRALVDLLLGERLSFITRVILPRTSDQDYKCFLYLRELMRTQQAPVGLPSVTLFDWLQSKSPQADAYRADRLSHLRSELESLAERTVQDTALERAIAETNAARTEARRIQDLREGATRVSGSIALPLIGARWNMPASEYTAEASRAARGFHGAPAVDRPRLLLGGHPADDTLLHERIETFETVVVTETGPWGALGCRSHIETGADPLAALAADYANIPAGARVPVDMSLKTFEGLLDDTIDGVVFWLPSYDSVQGWDVPRLRQAAARRGIPTVSLSRLDDASTQSAGFAEFLEAARRRHEGVRV